MIMCNKFIRNERVLFLLRRDVLADALRNVFLPATRLKNNMENMEKMEKTKRKIRENNEHLVPRTFPSNNHGQNSTDRNVQSY